MAYRITLYGNPVLRGKAETIHQITDKTKDLVEEMTKAMIQNEGIGLAAPQIGVGKRVIVVGTGQDIMVLINPEIMEKGDEEEVFEEGCLSVPGIYVEVSRSKHIKVTGKNLKGENVELEAAGYLARVLQHEIDHLNGVLVVDYLGQIRRQLLESKLKRLARMGRKI